jgi:hypothetical protein
MQIGASNQSSCSVGSMKPDADGYICSYFIWCVPMSYELPHNLIVILPQRMEWCRETALSIPSENNNKTIIFRDDLDDWNYWKPYDSNKAYVEFAGVVQRIRFNMYSLYYIGRVFVIFAIRIVLNAFRYFRVCVRKYIEYMEHVWQRIT